MKGRIIEELEKLQEEFASDMEYAFAGNNVEQNHVHADELMCTLLEDLGFGEGVEIFRSAIKWYA